MVDVAKGILSFGWQKARDRSMSTQGEGFSPTGTNITEGKFRNGAKTFD
jgi:hypothetical protein